MNNTTRVIYFNEGQGYFPIQNLGRGGDGVATLVRSRYNGQLYVRKEFDYLEKMPGSGVVYLTPQGDEEKLPREAVYSSREYTMARWLSAQHNIYKTEGWAYYANSEQKQGYGVSYFKYYNLGSLASVHLQLTKPLPEYWVMKLLLSMLRTVQGVHGKDTIHFDLGTNNWFMEYTPANSETGSPEAVGIFLGDCARAFTRQEKNTDDWFLACCLELHSVLVSVQSALTLGTVFEHYSPYSQATVDLLSRLRELQYATEHGYPARLAAWMEDAQAYSDSLIAVPWPLRAPEAVDKEYVLEEDSEDLLEDQDANRYFKWWSVAEIEERDEDKSIVAIHPGQVVGGNANLPMDLYTDGGFADLSSSCEPRYRLSQ